MLDIIVFGHPTMCSMSSSADHSETISEKRRKPLLKANKRRLILEGVRGSLVCYAGFLNREITIRVIEIV